VLTAAAPGARAASPAVRAAEAFLARLFPAPRHFDVRLWDGTVLPAQGASTFTLAVNAPGSLRRMFRVPLALSLGEAYVRGDFEIEGEVWAAAPGMQAYRDAVRSGRRLPEYFAHVYGVVKPGGLFLNHGIGGRVSPGRSVRRAAAGVLTERLVGSAEFRRRYIFPTGELVSVSEANLAAERAGFEVRDVENLREHYARTLRLWAQGLDANRDEAVRIGGMAMYRLRRIHLGVAAWQFEAGHLTLNQTLLARLDGGRASVPWSRGDLYA
jgi:hypothetical protein